MILTSLQVVNHRKIQLPWSGNLVILISRYQVYGDETEVILMTEQPEDRDHQHDKIVK